MRLPNKVISYNRSIISKFPLILDTLQVKPYSVIDLYNSVKTYMDIDDFLDIIDSLFALGKIRLNEQRRELYYVV